MFDKYWYRQREFQYIDAIQNVEQSQFLNVMSSKDEIEVEKQVVDKKNISSAEEKPINTLNKDKDSKANKEVIDKLDADTVNFGQKQSITTPANEDAQQNTENETKKDSLKKKKYKSSDSVQ